MVKLDYIPNGVQIERVKARAQIQSLLIEHGDLKLSELLTKLPAPAGHQCPKCNGTGTDIVTYDAYPSGLPDSGWAQDLRTYRAKCSVCNGEGYTPKKLVPKMVQQGWEEQ